MRALVLALVAACSALGAAAQKQPPLEAYGGAPFVRQMTLSPDGSTLAFIARKDGKDIITKYDLATRAMSVVADASAVSARDIWFANSEFLILHASGTQAINGTGPKFEFSAAYSLNLKTGKTLRMLARTDGLYPAQSGLGSVVGQQASNGDLYMPAFMGEPTADPDFDLLRVDPSSGFGKRIAHGTPYTKDWIVSPDGTVLAEETLDPTKKLFKIETRRNGRSDLIFKADTLSAPFSLVGVKEDGSALIVIDTGTGKSGFTVVRELGFDGTLSPPKFGRDGADIENVYKDTNRRVAGLRYSGARPSYQFFDAKLDQSVKALLAKDPAAAYELQSWSADWNTLLWLVFDGQAAGMYHVQDRAKGTLSPIASPYSNVPREAVASVADVVYPARDKLKIPAILTLPPGVEFSKASALPLIVMPHGGPAAHDSVGFDWMAQYFANRGYLVFQPNFRGSSGYGEAFERAGDGEWGGKMQDDITDGVKMLIDEKLADPKRVCIVGASYGGYAALAGGAFTPDLYRCVVAIAPVSDLPQMIRENENRYGKNATSSFYWRDIIGNPRYEKDKLAQISPSNSAAAFKAPVLLIHGEDDTVVSMRQSQTMQAALKKEGKPVELVKLKGEDHWLSDSATRIETLKAAAAFVDQHIGRADAQNAQDLSSN